MRTQLRKDEAVVLDRRQHWAVILWPVFFTLLMYASYSSVEGTRGNEDATAFIGTVYLVSIAYLVYQAVAWYTTHWIVTNRRVILESGLIATSRKESPLEKIHNVADHRSLFGYLLGYGSIEIQTAAEWGTSKCKYIPRAHFLAETISEQQERLTESTAQTASEKSKECPYCAETIKANAKVCRYCSRELSS